MHREKIFALLLLVLAAGLFNGCKKDDDDDPTEETFLVIKLKFDPNQARLDNFGQPATIPAGHAAQTPTFNQMGVHYIELSEADDIPAYNGIELYNSPTTTEGGSGAIDFDQARYAADGEEIFRIKLSDVAPGTYAYLRMSLSYQNYDIAFRANGTALTGTIASFVGANTYIRNYTIKNESVTVNANKLQGYWGFETDFSGVPVITGQAPEGATTVPNPIAATSAIPLGSCLVTGEFASPLSITGDETEDIVLTASVSINNSFEWIDGNANGTFEPTEGDTVVDMGVRGLVPIVE